MSRYNDDEITRDGFTCAYGRFYTELGRVECIEGSALRSMFLPRLTPEGSRKLALHHADYFVRGQLQHYGVQFNENEISGSGTILLKKSLQARKCDRVPDHLVRLREQMHLEWLKGLAPELLSSHPSWVMERYFLSAGRPDRTKTTVVVGIPLDTSSSYRAGQMREAASKVVGLYEQTGFGPETQTIFLGWDSVAVSKAAKGHAAKEAKKFQAKEDERDNERVRLHKDYLNTLKQRKGPKALKTYSPVGSYIVDCKEIETQWPDEADDLCLDIRRTKESGIFEASFDFGILTGIMLISAENSALEQYCAQLDHEAESDWDDDEDEGESEDDRKATTGSKRKAEALRGRGRPSKKSNTEAVEPLLYVLKLKSRETGEGMINFMAEDGSIKFNNKNFASFEGEANISCVGQGVHFTARKISDTPAYSNSSWNDYSERAYEHARVARWH